VHSLRTKFLAAFILVTFIVVGSVALAANMVTTHQFDQYLLRAGEFRAQRVAPLIAEYYDRQGGWQGIEQFLLGLSEPTMTRRGPQRLLFLLRDRLVVANADGIVVFDSHRQMEGQRLDDQHLASGVPILAHGEQVGTVLIVPLGRMSANSLERHFLTTVNRWLLTAGALVGGLAIPLGLYLAWQITAPLRQLREAAQAIASGDLTRRVRVTSGDEIGDLAQAFNQMAEALEEDEQLRCRMIADIAHELRTPLSVIRANLEALQDGVFPLSNETLVPIHEEALLLTRLVEDLHQLALAEAGQLTLERQMVNVEDLIHQTIKGHRPQAVEKGIKLRIDIPQSLPLASLDPQRIGQVLRNLLSNALRYTPRGGKITISCQPFEVHQDHPPTHCPVPAALLPLEDGAWLAFSVADTGPGIASEDLPHIFERFYRSDKSRSHASGGTGLGLAIARRLVEAHQGKLIAENEPQGGARFTFVLPVRQATS